MSDTNPMVAIVAKVLKMKNNERYLRTIHLAVKEKRNQLTIEEMMELNACIAQNSIVNQNQSTI